MEEWQAAYARILGETVSTLAWCPIWCDTPDVVAELNRSQLSFSGGALIVCETNQLFLTWKQAGQQFCLSPSQVYEDNWRSDALDRIQCGQEAPWENVRGSVLTQVCLYAEGPDSNRRIVGARHGLRRGDRMFTLWIGTGDSHGIGDHDDLWISIDNDPPNMATLVKVLTLPVASV